MGRGQPVLDLLVTTAPFRDRPEALLFEGPFRTGTYDRGCHWFFMLAIIENSKRGLLECADGLDDLLLVIRKFINDTESKGIVYLQLGEGL